MNTVSHIYDPFGSYSVRCISLRRVLLLPLKVLLTVISLSLDELCCDKDVVTADFVGRIETSDGVIFRVVEGRIPTTKTWYNCVFSRKPYYRKVPTDSVCWLTAEGDAVAYIPSTKVKIGTTLNRAEFLTLTEQTEEEFTSREARKYSGC